jgi:triacylglycerol lipase
MIKTILIHGIWDKPNKFDYLVKKLKEAGYTNNLLIEITPNDASISIEEMAIQLKNFINKNISRDERFNIIGYSMGGIIGRYYLQFINPNSNIHKLVTISSPHNGTLTAYMSQLKGSRDLRPNSDVIKKFNDNSEFMDKNSFMSIYTEFDAMILPHTSSKVNSANNITVPVAAHHLMLKSNAVAQMIIKFLRD